jgi:hypothetical protein
MGIDAKGVDLDQPVLRGSPNEFMRILTKNGFERLLKSFVRFFLFDGRVRTKLVRELDKRGYGLTISDASFIVCDVENLELEEGSIDLIFSEDAFEHIPPETLIRLMPRMKEWLASGGLAIIRPCVYTGITGGHLMGWYTYDILHNTVGQRAEPWEHLRKKRFKANTYLNRFSLADYRKLFLKDFVILEEKVKYPGLGKEYLTPEIREDLKDFSEEELLSNQVLFVLSQR